MNILSLDKQIEIIAALCEGVGQRAVSRLTDTDRKTVARLAFNVGRGAAELHDRMMVGLRVHRIECDELWAYVGHKRDQYTYVALASSSGWSLLDLPGGPFSFIRGQYPFIHGNVMRTCRCLVERGRHRPSEALERKERATDWSPTGPRLSNR